MDKSPLLYRIASLFTGSTRQPIMSRINHSLARQADFGSSMSFWRCLSVVLATSIFLFSSGCDRKAVPPPPEAEPLVMNGHFPIAEPALSNAVIRGDFKETQRIVASGANINSKDALDRTPLHLAAFYGRTKTIAFLIENGAEVDAKDHIGMTPLHAAVISGRRQSVQLLLEKQANIHTQTESGQTALHLSAATGQPRLTRFLIEQGANPNQKDLDGKTPLYYAKKNYHPQTTSVLEQMTPKKTHQSQDARMR